MKKIYMIPEVEIVEVQTQQMLAASALGIGENFAEGDVVVAPELNLDGMFDNTDNLDSFFE